MAHDCLVLAITLIVILALLAAGALVFLMTETMHDPEQVEEQETSQVERRTRQLERETEELGTATRNALLREALRRANYQRPDRS